jgi:hypothetical protein
VVRKIGADQGHRPFLNGKKRAPARLCDHCSSSKKSRESLGIDHVVVVMAWLSPSALKAALA